MHTLLYRHDIAVSTIGKLLFGMGKDKIERTWIACQQNTGRYIDVRRRRTAPKKTDDTRA